MKGKKPAQKGKSSVGKSRVGKSRVGKSIEKSTALRAPKRTVKSHQASAPAKTKTKTAKPAPRRTIKSVVRSLSSVPNNDDPAGEELLGRAERMVAMAVARGAQQAEAFLESGSGLEVEVQAGRVANTGAGRTSGGSIRLVVGGRVGFAYLTRDEETRGAVERALQQARHAPDKGYILPTGTPPRSLPGRWDSRVAGLDVADAMDLMDGVLAGSKETAPKATVAGAGVSLDAGITAIASSQEVACWDRATMVSCAASLVLPDGERSVSASESADRHAWGLDGHAVGREAGITVMSLAKPKKVAGGSLDVVFRPDAAAELVTGLVVSAALGDEAMKGKTVWSEKLGKPVAAAMLDVRDDSWYPSAISGTPFDDEGVATRSLPIVQGGVLKTFLFDSWDAHLHSEATTASAVRSGFKTRPGTGTHHLVVESPHARPAETLIAGVDEGLLVDSVLGAHTANVTTGDFSVTSANVWRIRKGAVVGPVSEVALSGNLPKLLSSLDGISSEAKARDGLRMPSMRFRGVSVSV